ncbi:sporulation histidine kinase inhibitor Sda [Alkalihalobacterium chitinilyticum]|uniref:Sporulation histidine kinase inhibitor Sda n=1 Tax=Alkalihalobacterium chitinilyticum TaxID=2980103 RepID=A0ABT5VH70_9BACI|nr:sporulation histidine kinase inhibitor Sda [Alkalihalobacterium chitinilyticum]MDE5414784.1 sporulation histidine kinase inhibitor Sda [Alkalihalobacterium chitinilyticum]
MYRLSDELLVNTYKKAKDLNLEKEFIKMLEKEMDNRKIQKRY